MRLTLSRSATLVLATALLAACGSDAESDHSGSSPDAANDAQPSDAGVDLADADVAPPDTSATETDAVPAAPVVGRCDYTNPFSGSAECKEYTGSGWDAGSADENCTGDTVGTGMVFVPDVACSFESELGRCVVGDPTVDGYTLVLSGADAGQCAISQTACETFIGGTFAPSEVCEDTGPVTPPTPSGVFVPPTLECRPPLEGEEPGMGENGEVCTWTMISGCTEPGRRYVDYASCEPVLTQRPYYGYEAIYPEPPADDPRLTDERYLGEVAWVREQVEACACVCCHSDETAPRGPSGWHIEAGPIWTDSIPDSGIAMMAGIVDSAALGAYPSAQNNGFDRDLVGLPTTDVERMEAFFLEEWLRRGLNDEDAARIPPFGGPLVSQREFVPAACSDGLGVDGEGKMQWGGGAARYVYVLEPGSANPGVPPNLDLPEGTLWHIAVPPSEEPLGSGIAYGDVPAGATQRVPVEGAAPALASGEQYYLYVLLDIAVPLARCLFTAP